MFSLGEHYKILTGRTLKFRLRRHMNVLTGGNIRVFTGPNFQSFISLLCIRDGKSFDPRGIIIQQNTPFHFLSLPLSFLIVFFSFFLDILQCHAVHRTLADQFKYALVWVSASVFHCQLASLCIFL